MKQKIKLFIVWTDQSYLNWKQNEIFIKYTLMSYLKCMGTLHAHYIALHCITLHCIALHCVPLHCIPLHYITLHCVVPENIHTPTIEGIGNSRGEGGSKAQKISEGWGG